MDVGLGSPVRFGPYPVIGVLGFVGASRSTLASGQSLKQGDQLVSPNGRFKAALQPDSNFVIYDGARPLRAWGQNGNDTVAMQSDGNLVLYAKGNPTWASDTSGNGGARLVMQDDGNLVVYAPNGGALWGSETDGGRVYEPSKSLFSKITDVVTAPSRAALTDVARAATGKDITITSISVSPKQLLQAVETAVSFVPGVGQGINAAIAAGAALANGENIDDAFVDAAKNAIPGGPVAAAALDTAYKTVRAAASGQNIGDAALAAARDQIPGGDIAKRAFDMGVAIAHGQNVQEAIKSGVTNFAVSQLSGLALPPALMQASNILPPEATRVATTIFNRPELQNLPIADIAKALNVNQNTASVALKAATDAVKADPNAVLARLTPAQQKALAAQTALAQLGKLSPTQQKSLVAYASLSKLSPEQQKALVAYASKKPPTVHEAPAKAVVVASSTPKPAIPPRGAPKVATTQFRFGPYPKNAGTVSAPPPHGHGGGGHHGGGDGHRVFRGGRRIPGWGRWDGPWNTEIVAVTQTCQAWSEPVPIPASMQSAAKIAVGASQGQPTTLQGDDGRLYLISLERGVIVARVCAAFA